MKGNSALSMALGLCLVALACTESIRVTGNNNTTTQSEQKRVSHTGPILVSLDDFDRDQMNNVISIGGNSAVVISDRNSEFDQSAVKGNKRIRSRGSVAIKTSGQSRLIQRTHFTLGEISSYDLYEYDAVTGLRTMHMDFNSPGVDLIWFNADDDIADYTTFGVTINGVETLSASYNGAGPDAIWLTEDDAVLRYTIEVLDATGGAVAHARINAPGVDGVWFTEDDVIQYATAEIMAVDGSMEWIQYIDAGPDLDWATVEDNAVGHFSSTLVNAGGMEERHLFYLDPGLDLIAFNADDTLSFYHDYTYDDQGRFSSSILYTGAGADLEWLTADDVVEVCEAVTYLSDGLVDKEIHTSAGADLTCFTADDVTTGYDSHAFDATGHLIHGARYGDAGVDLQWFSEDDVKSREGVFEPL